MMRRYVAVISVFWCLACATTPAKSSRDEELKAKAADTVEKAKVVERKKKPPTAKEKKKQEQLNKLRLARLLADGSAIYKEETYKDKDGKEKTRVICVAKNKAYCDESSKESKALEKELDARHAAKAKKPDSKKTSAEISDEISEILKRLHISSSTK